MSQIKFSIKTVVLIIKYIYIHTIEHYEIYTRQLTIRLITLKEERPECLDTFKTQTGHVAKNKTFCHPARNQTRLCSQLFFVRMFDMFVVVFEGYHLKFDLNFFNDLK